MKFGFRAGRGATGAALLGVLVLLPWSACAPSGSREVFSGEDLFGETLNAPDPARADLRLAAIPPPLTVPADPTADSPPLAERASKALDRGIALSAEGRHTEAALELEKALRLAPDHPAVLRALAENAWEAGEYAQAEGHAAALLTTAPGDLVAHYLQGRLAARQFDNARAILAFRTALACAAGDSHAAHRILTLYHLAETLSAEGYATAAIEAYNRCHDALDTFDASAPAPAELAALKRGGAAALNDPLAAAYAQLGQFAEAAEWLRRGYPDLANDGRSGDPALLLRYAKYLGRSGDLVSAAAAAGRALGDDEEAVEVLRRIREAQGTPEMLPDDLRAACERSPENVKLLLALADVLRDLHRDAEAVALLEARYAEQPQADVAWALSDAQAAGGDWRAVLLTLAEVVRAQPVLLSDAEQRVRALVTDVAAVPTPPADADHVLMHLLGVWAQAAGDSEAAIGWYEGALAAAPQFVPSRVALGTIYVGQYAWQRAQQVLAPQDVELSPDTRIELLLGRIALGLDRIDEAETHFTAALRLNRANIAAAEALADLYQGAGAAEQAVRQWEKVVKEDPLNDAARERLFHAYLSDGDHRAAGEQLAAMRRNAAAPTRIARCVARLEYRSGHADAEEAYRATLQQAMAASREDVDTLSMIAHSFERDRRYGKAIAILERAVVMDSSRSDVLEQLARCCQYDLRFERALTLLDELMPRRPNKWAWKAAAMDLLLVLQRFDDALALAEKLRREAGDSDDADAAIRVTVIQTHLLREDTAAAIEELESWRGSAPQNIGVLQWLIATCQKADRHERALELIRVWAGEIPSGFVAGGGAFDWRQLLPEHRDVVVQLFLDQIENEPDNDDLHFAFIRMLREIGRFEDALTLAQNSVPAVRDPSLYEAEIYRTYDAAERFDDALGLINRMLTSSGQHRFTAVYQPIELQLELAQLLIKAQRYDKALEKINRWIEDTTDTQEKLVYLRLLTLAQQEAGRFQEAVEALQLALELDPDDVGLHNDLGYTLADVGEDLERAEAMVRFAVAHEPRNSAYLDSLGWVLYKRGDFDGARLWLQRARHAGAGEDPVVCDHLGDACWRLGDSAGAEKFWAEAVRFAEERLQEAWPRDADRKTQASAQAKLDAAGAGQPPALAPLGEND